MPHAFTNTHSFMCSCQTRASHICISIHMRAAATHSVPRETYSVPPSSVHSARKKLQLPEFSAPTATSSAAHPLITLAPQTVPGEDLSQSGGRGDVRWREDEAGQLIEETSWDDRIPLSQLVKVVLSMVVVIYHIYIVYLLKHIILVLLNHYFDAPCLSTC